MKIPVLYEDNELLVLDKPPGLVVDQSITQKGLTLADILQFSFGINLLRAGIVHRLDKDTSGIILVAKTKEALEALQKQFKNREVKKEYLALVHGNLEQERVVDAPIERNPKNREKFTVLEEGREAVTKFVPMQRLEFSDQRLVEIFPDFSKIQMRKLYTLHYTRFTLLKCLPLTGRTHQIRVHLKYIGNPLVGDEKYGGRKISRLDKRWCRRQFLHAKRIEFKHPSTGKSLSFECDLPEDLKEALDKLNG